MGFLEDRDFGEVPTIPEFYKGKTIFITGGTGFMGQTLIEKLLYSCTDLERIYLLMRSKKEVKSEDRIDSLYSSLCFDRLRTEKPGIFESKVFIISGDAQEIGLGLSEEDRVLLINRVNIIFHAAASVRKVPDEGFPKNLCQEMALCAAFNDTLPDAAKLNLRGTRELIELAKEVRDLNALVHVSTCYSNTSHNLVEEKMYPPLADWRDTLDICESVDGHILDVLTNKYINGMPNTYVFTKQLAEHVVYEQKGQLPAVIIRPSIVICSVEEPFAGWVYNFNGPVGIFVAGGKGIMRSLYSPPDHVNDFIPADASIRHFIAAAWIRGTKKLEATDDVAIYNCCANDLMRFTMEELCSIGKTVAHIYPTDGIIWHPGFSCTIFWPYHYMIVLLFQVLPAIFIDLLLWVSGRETLLLKVQRRMYQANLALRYYMNKQWRFDNKNFLLLRSCIKERDRSSFFYKLEGLDKHKYFMDGVLGGKKCLLNEKLEDLPKARAHYYRMMVLDYFVKCAFFACISWKIWNSSYVQNFVEAVLGF